MSSERFRSAAVGGLSKVVGSPARPTSVAALVADLWRRAMVRSRLIVGLALITAGVVWAIARGLSCYGLNLSGAYDDLAQPPVLLIVIGAWLLGRSGRR